MAGRVVMPRAKVFFFHGWDGLVRITPIRRPGPGRRLLREVDLCESASFGGNVQADRFDWAAFDAAKAERRERGSGS